VPHEVAQTATKAQEAEEPLRVLCSD
jgi:hypothetical protein